MFEFLDVVLKFAQIIQMKAAELHFGLVILRSTKSYFSTKIYAKYSLPIETEFDASNRRIMSHARIRQIKKLSVMARI